MELEFYIIFLILGQWCKVETYLDSLSRQEPTTFIGPMRQYCFYIIKCFHLHFTSILQSARRALQVQHQRTVIHHKYEILVYLDFMIIMSGEKAIAQLFPNVYRLRMFSPSRLPTHIQNGKADSYECKNNLFHISQRFNLFNHSPSTGSR